MTQVAKVDFRPYLHPIVAPDGRGELTQYSPGHHKHQTGLYWGFTRVNGRDYFHHPEGTYWKRVSLNVLTAEANGPDDSVQWQTVYDLLGEDGTPVLRESQIWTMRDLGDRYVIDLQWQGQAAVDVTVGRYDYGGLFLRMPWREGIEGHVTNSARQVDARAEGGRAVWLDVGMQVEGRDDLAHIAIFDHPSNDGFPLPWRVDGQMGVGPVRARLGDWSIEKGESSTILHRLVVYGGKLDDVDLTEQWSEFSGQGMAWAQWKLAQQEGREAEFLTPQRAVESMTLQPGFEANVYASEPMMTQPMAFCWDAKGRIWIAENRDYETRGSGFSNDGGSRILILEDTDRDGVADSTKGVPRGDSVSRRDRRRHGWPLAWGSTKFAVRPRSRWRRSRRCGRHRSAIDGLGHSRSPRDVEQSALGTGRLVVWMPGLRHAVTCRQTCRRRQESIDIEILFLKTSSLTGNRSTSTAESGGTTPPRIASKWSAHGFSNPWGIDYDAKGQLFITACVIPHLWHVIPGGIYHRQGGSHFNPFVYSDIRTIADHRHRSAHGGARVYLSDAFPEQYRGRIFMANIHEHAVLTDILQPKGSGFVGVHGDDFALANNAQWIGFSIEIGPEGAVYALDWHDADICGKDVLNKDTGRIFRFTAKQSAAKDFANRYADLTGLEDLALAQMQRVDSAWHARNRERFCRSVRQPDSSMVMPSSRSVDYWRRDNQRICVFARCGLCTSLGN